MTRCCYQNKKDGTIESNQSKITLNGVVSSPELWSAEILFIMCY